MTTSHAPAEGAERAAGADRSGPAGRTAVVEDLADFHHRLAGVGAALAGPGGHALVPSSLLGSISHLLTPGGRVAHRPGTTTVSVVGPLDHLAVVRTSERPAEAAGPDTAAVTELARLRHAWSGQLLRDVVDHLATRTTGGKPLLEQQLVKSSLADAFIGRQETETVLTASDAGGGELDLVHERITEVDRTLLRLLGAHGFTADGPGSVAYVSELLAHVYTRRADHDGT